MSSPAQSIVTLRSVFRAGLIWGAEYAMLSLIEDSSVTIRVATGVIAGLGLLTLEGEAWLRRQHKHLFWSAILVLVVVWLGFFGWAVKQAHDEVLVGRYLDQSYADSGVLWDRKFPFNSQTKQFDEAALQQWQRDIEKWRDTTANYIRENIDEYTKERFLNTIGMQSYNFTPNNMQTNDTLDNAANTLDKLRKNLAAIRDRWAQRK